MKLNKMNTGKLIASTSMLITLIMLLLVAFTATNVISADNDWFNMSVSVSNLAPQVNGSTMVFNDGVAGADVQLTASSNTNIVSCNATAWDQNGYQDIVSASAKFWHQNYTLTSADDKNNHYSMVNGTLGPGKCFVDTASGSGNNVPIICETYLEHEAANGTWTCNITVTDSGSATGSNTTTVAVAQLLAMTVVENTLNFGAMAPGQESSTLPANVTNEGNVRIGVQVNGTEMVCSITDSIPLANIKYSSTNQAYGDMSTVLSDTAATVAGFSLVPEGIDDFSEDQLASENTYWSIKVPLGVSGTCVGNVTVTAIIN